ncbi:MAG TPA: OmpA family protein, partial [Aliiroseovarius sp.]|nr:OmpA family protein [Aliiroseovarius sp.]
GDAAAGLELAVGMPDGAWPDVARTGLTALQGLERGEMHLRDRALTVTGAAATPHAKTMAEAALADLPEGYTSDVQITTLDDGQPVAYTVTYSREGGANVSGKLPHGADAASIAAALGVDAVSGEARSAGIGAPDAANGLHATLSALAGQIDDIDTLSIEQGLTGKVVHATLRPGADGEGLRAALGSILGDAAELQVVSPAAPAVEPAPEPAPEAATEPAPAPEPAPAEVATEAAPASLPDIPTCLARAKAVQAEAKINFLTASADLDPASTAVVDALAEVITGCLANPDLRVEVGGHTDSDGSDTANYILSKERAQAVLDALVARGVPAGRIIAVGFGETEPIADNSTAEGKAANRRTAIRWFGLGQ